MPIDLAKFKELQTEKSAGYNVDELLEFLGEQACTNKEIAEFLNVTPTNAGSRMKRLEKKKVVERRYAGAIIYWAKV